MTKAAPSQDISLYDAVLTGQLTTLEADAKGDAKMRADIRDGRKPQMKRLLHICPECGQPVKQSNVGGRGKRTLRHPTCKELRNRLDQFIRALDEIKVEKSEACGCEGEGPRCWPGNCPNPAGRMTWHQAKNVRSELWSICNSLNALGKGLKNDDR